MNNPVSCVKKRAQTPRNTDLRTLCFSSIPSFASRSNGCPLSLWLRRCVAFRIEDMAAGLSVQKSVSDNKSRVVTSILELVGAKAGFSPTAKRFHKQFLDQLQHQHL